MTIDRAFSDECLDVAFETWAAGDGADLIALAAQRMGDRHARLFVRSVFIAGSAAGTAMVAALIEADNATQRASREEARG